MTSQDKIKMFCSYLKEHQYVTRFHIYNGELGGVHKWEIYHEISGYINGKYFNIVIMKIEKHDPYVQIPTGTKYVPFIKHTLSKFGLS